MSISTTTAQNNESELNIEPDKVFHGEINKKIACLNCREKKLKCDKLIPICTRCSKKNIPCIYVEHKKTGPKPNSQLNPRAKRMSTSINNSDNNIINIKKKSKLSDNALLTNDISSLSSPSSIPSSVPISTSVSTSVNIPINQTNNILSPLNASQYNLKFLYDQKSSPNSLDYQNVLNHLNNVNNLTNNTNSNNNNNNNNNSSNNNNSNTNNNNSNNNNSIVDSSSRISLNSFMNPMSPLDQVFYSPISQSLVQNSTTNLRNDDSTTIKGNIIKKDEKLDVNNNTTTNNNTNNNNKKNDIDSANADAKNNVENNDRKLNNNKPNVTMTATAIANATVNNSSNTIKKNTIHTNNDSSSTFNTSLTNKTNKSFEEIIGLPKLGLKMEDIDKFHAFYFNSNTRIFKYSIPRYYNTFVKEPKMILHYSYMIWTIACFYLDQYEHMVDKMYQTSLIQMNEYWESNRDSFHSDILTYLHALCLKSQFEFLSGREMRSALTVSSSVRLTQMYGYDQIDLSPTTLNTPAIFFRSFSLSADHFESTNTLLQDDDLDPDIPLVEERRRVLWEIYAIDKWSSLVTGLPCILSVDNLSVIFTKLPSPTTFLPLNNDSEILESENEQSSYYLHEAMQKLDNNQVLLDINSSSSKILLLTISENIIKWCKMFLNMVELETLKSSTSINSIRNKVDELVRNFESMHNNLLFFDLTTEPLMNIVITNTSTLLYQSVLIKFSSLFDLQFKEDPSGSNIGTNEISLFKDILYEVAAMSEKLLLRFIKKSRVENHLKKAPVFIVFINSIKSLFQCIAFVYRFNSILKVDEEKKKSLLNTIKLTATRINEMPGKTPLVLKTKTIINNGQELLDHSPHLLSFFDSFFDSAKTY